MRVAAVQIHSENDRDRNLATAERLVRDAAGSGARLVVLPEKFNVLGDTAQLRAGAELLGGHTTQWASGLARELEIYMVAGSIVEQDESGSLHNTSLLIDPSGEIAAKYRKLHMFDVDVGDVSYRESELEDPGDRIVVGSVDRIKLGLAICYDLRFPELFRILTLEGARIMTLPSAFTMRTGRDHWEVLLRARAIENQVFTIAANQVGTWPKGCEHYGRSMIVDPWGVVLAKAGDSECFAVADLDLSYQDQVRSKLPSLSHRRPEIYGPSASGADDG